MTVVDVAQGDARSADLNHARLIGAADLRSRLRVFEPLDADSGVRDGDTRAPLTRLSIPRFDGHARGIFRQSV